MIWNKYNNNCLKLGPFFFFFDKCLRLGPYVSKLNVHRIRSNSGAINRHVIAISPIAPTINITSFNW